MFFPLLPLSGRSVERFDDQAVRVGRAVERDPDLQQVAARVDLVAHPVVLRRIQPGQWHPPRPGRQRATHVAVAGFPEEHHGPPRTDVLNAGRQSIDLAIGNQLSKDLVLLDMTRRRRQLLVGPARQVRADAEDTGHRDVEVEVERSRATVVRTLGVGPPRAHQVRREAGAETSLDPEPIQRCRVVARPERVDARGHREIHPRASAGAAFDVHVGMRDADHLENPVQVRDRETVEILALIAAVQPRPVRVPLQVLDVVRRQQPIESAPDELRDIVPTQVEQQLVTDLDGLVSSRPQDPLRMLRGQSRLRAHRLRLDPQSEVEPDVLQLRDEAVQAIGELGRIDLPVAQPAGVVRPADEPAVVDHEGLDADARRPPAQFELMLRTDVELGGEPRVVQHLGRTPTRRGPLVLVKGPGQPVRTLSATRTDSLRRHPRLARPQYDPKTRRNSAGLDPQQPGRVDVRAHLPRSGPRELNAVRHISVGRQERRVRVTGDALRTPDREAPTWERHLSLLELAVPPTPQVPDRRPGRNDEGRRVVPVQGEGVGSIVAQRHPPLQYVAHHPVVQNEPDTTALVDKRDLQFLPSFDQRCLFRATRIWMTGNDRFGEDRAELVGPIWGADHQLDRSRVADAADGVLKRLYVGPRHEVLGADNGNCGRPVGDRMWAPGNQLCPLAVVRYADDVRRRRTAQGPRLHLTAPIANPPTKCFWNRRKTATVGTAAMTVPAAITFQEETKRPGSPSRAGVTGIWSPDRITVIDHSKSLKIQVNDNAPRAASAGRVSGRMTLA